MRVKIGLKISSHFQISKNSILIARGILRPLLQARFFRRFYLIFGKILCHVVIELIFIVDSVIEVPKKFTCFMNDRKSILLHFSIRAYVRN